MNVIDNPRFTGESQIQRNIELSNLFLDTVLIPRLSLSDPLKSDEICILHGEFIAAHQQEGANFGIKTVLRQALKRNEDNKIKTNIDPATVEDADINLIIAISLMEDLLHHAEETIE